MNLFVHTLISLVCNGISVHAITNSQAVAIVRLFFTGQWG